MGVDVKGMNADEAAVSAINAVKELSKKIGIPQRLSEIGIKETDLEMLAKDAIIDPCTGGNPAPVTEADILEIYKKAL
jgi:lactaldehyde reductase